MRSSDKSGLKQLASSLIALAAGIALLWLVPVVLAIVAALPGLGAVLRFIKAHDLPPALFTVLVSLVPQTLVAFAVGTMLVKGIRDAGLKHLLLCASPWLLRAAYVFIQINTDPELDTDLNWAWEIPAIALVPAGVLLSLAARPANDGTPPFRAGVQG